jgi:AraC-like DNA-binding protein
MDVPIERSSFASTSADQAWDALSRMYTRARPHTSSPDAALSVDSAVTPDLAVDQVRLTGAEGAFSESPEQVNVISVLGGRISLDFGRHGTAANGPGDSYLYLPDSPADLEWDTFSALAVRLPMTRVTRTATELTGLGLAALRFASMRPVSAPLGRLWLRTATYAWEMLSDPDGGAGHVLVHQQLVDHLAATALAVFPNTTMTGAHAPGPGSGEPATVRRAVEFMDARAGEAITISDIADAARIGARGLQAAFHRHREEPPLQYLRRVRMDRAHRGLQAGDPTRGDTVAEIAARWGFTHPGRFSVEYRRNYGCPPSETLRE